MASAIRPNSRLNDVEAWLDANKIGYRLHDTPIIRAAYNSTVPPNASDADNLLINLYQVGFSRGDVEHSTKCITTDVIITGAGGANIYFLFSSDGSLIAHRLDEFNLGL